MLKYMYKYKTQTYFDIIIKNKNKIYDETSKNRRKYNKKKV